MVRILWTHANNIREKSLIPLWRAYRCTWSRVYKFDIPFHCATHQKRYARDLMSIEKGLRLYGASSFLSTIEGSRFSLYSNGSSNKKIPRCPTSQTEHISAGPAFEPQGTKTPTYATHVCKGVWGYRSHKPGSSLRVDGRLERCDRPPQKGDAL